jgi:DNA (cytosine-5)-methyltransferase 1
MRSAYTLRISLEISMQFGSVCSGIEAASVAFNALGWKAAWLSEIDAFPSALLSHHYPDVPNLGDMTFLPDLIRNGTVTAPEMLCGGTPCQAFSMAGNRQSLDDNRGNLSLIFCEIANAIDDVRRARREKPAIILWENVPGVLSTHDNAFGSFLAGLAGESKPLITPRNKWPNAGLVIGPIRSIAWRILDAQYFGLAQRRKRVFLVSSARDDIDIGQILFEFGSVQKHHRPIREIRKADSDTSQRSTDGQSSAGMTYSISGNGVHTGKLGKAPGYEEELSPAITENHHPSVAFKVRGKGTYTGENGGRIVNTNIFGGHGMIVSEEKTFTIASTQDQYIAYTMREDAKAKNFHIKETDVSLTLQATQSTVNSHHAQMLIAQNHTIWQKIGFDPMRVQTDDIAPALTSHMGTGGGNVPMVDIRRLTPRECERLQGFPDDYTLIPFKGKMASDAPRYKALGNSWPVPVVQWIGRRIMEILK